MTIRSRLLWLTVGLVVPLVLVGFFSLWEAWRASRTQLNESIGQQAKLAATAFEQWISAQNQTLTTVSILAESDSTFTLRDYLNSIIKTRPHWLDVQVVDASGTVVLSQTVRDRPLPMVSTKTIRQEIAAKRSLVIFAEQVSDESLRLLSLALPIANGGFVVARIDGSSASDVFRRLELPRENIIAVFDPNNRLLYRNNVSPEQMSLDVSNTPLLSTLGASDQTATIEVESPYDKIPRVYGLARVEGAQYVVAVGIPSERLYGPAKGQYWRQFWIGLAITALAVLLAIFIARSIVAPLQGLTDAAHEFGRGDMSARARVGGGGAVYELGKTFNQMAEQIAEREEKLREVDRLKSEFVSSVSHELRTPLTTIKALVSVMLKKEVDDERREEYLRTVAEECDRQIEFVQNLLDLSRIESGAYQASLSKVDIVQLISALTEKQQKAAAARGLELTLQSEADHETEIRTDPEILVRILLNLFENAMKYTPEGGAIVVRFVERSDEFTITVEDTGCGIAEADLPHVFEKFYRGRPNQPPGGSKDIDGSPSNETPGTGLGLYLTANFAREIGAEIQVESPASAGAGTRFTLRLPLGHESQAAGSG